MQSPNPKQKPKPPIPETIGATTAPFELGPRITTISFAIHAPTGPALLRADGQPKRVLIRIENMKSTLAAPTFDAYLNVPHGEVPEKRPDLFALTLSTFGLVESSRTREQHPGNGLSFLEDVSELYTRLIAARNFDSKALQVTFVPAPWKDENIHVQIGRVSLVIE